MKKYFNIICIVMIILISIATPTYSKALTLTDIYNKGDSFLNDADGSEVLDKENEENAINTLYWILLGIAVAVAVIIGTVMGIQFITSGVSGQAKIKEKLIPYAIGCVVSSGAFGIWKVVMTILNSAF